VIRWLGDLLSPAACAACSTPVTRADVIFCSPCRATIERCTGTDEIIAFGHYGGALSTAIRRFKYEDARYLARPLGALATIACLARSLRVDAIVPVPLHPRRLVPRGYNQSALLGGQVASQLGVPLVTSALVRTTDTPPQAELSREARLTNVRGAFCVTTRARCLRGLAVALIDDVSTTGATLHACAERALEAGATRVTSVVVALTISTPDRLFPSVTPVNFPAEK
jgi:ComF family protein